MGTGATAIKTFLFVKKKGSIYFLFFSSSQRRWRKTFIFYDETTANRQVKSVNGVECKSKSKAFASNDGENRTSTTTPATRRKLKVNFLFKFQLHSRTRRTHTNTHSLPGIGGNNVILQHASTSSVWRLPFCSCVCRALLPALRAPWPICDLPLMTMMMMQKNKGNEDRRAFY